MFLTQKAPKEYTRVPKKMGYSLSPRSWAEGRKSGTHNCFRCPMRKNPSEEPVNASLLFLEMSIFWRKRSTTLIPVAYLLLSHPRSFSHLFSPNHISSLLPLFESANSITLSSVPSTYPPCHLNAHQITRNVQNSDATICLRAQSRAGANARPPWLRRRV